MTIRTRVLDLHSSPVCIGESSAAHDHGGHLLSERLPVELEPHGVVVLDRAAAAQQVLVQPIEPAAAAMQVQEELGVADDLRGADANAQVLAHHRNTHDTHEGVDLCEKKGMHQWSLYKV